MRALVYALAALALARSSGAGDQPSGAEQTSGAVGALATSRDGCPASCVCDESDGEREYSCRSGGHQYTVKGQPNDFARIICSSGDLDLSSLPLFPLSANGTLNSVSVHECSLGGTLASMLARLGARGALDLTLDAPRSPLAAPWLAGVDTIEKLVILKSEEQKRVPWDVVKALPALKDFRLRETPLTLDEPPGEEGTEDVAEHPSLSSLEVSLGGVRALPAGVLARAPLARLTRLYLWGNQITNITGDSFIGLPRLEVLDLSRNPFPALPARALAPLTSLRHLTLVATGLTAIDQDAFQGLDRLEKVVVKYCARGPLQLRARALGARPALADVALLSCALRPLPEDLFHHSYALENVTISGAGLASLPAGLFRDQRRLRRLVLTDNALVALAPRVLWPLRALRALALDDNRLEELPEQLLSGLTQLKQFSCERNRLSRVAASALQGATGLDRLSLADNNLTFEAKAGEEESYWSLESQSPVAPLRQLTELVLRGNRLRRVFSDWTWLLVNLRHLDLSHNHITHLTRADVQFLAANATIDLRHNMIEAVEVLDARGGVLAATPTGSVILLDDNPFRCDCDLYAFTLRLEGASHPITAEPRLDPGDARCASPPELAGLPLRGLPSAALTCALRPQDCPQHCTCRIRPSTLALELDCTQEPSEYPDPSTFGLTQTHLRLHRAESLHIPPHVTLLNLSRLNLTEPPPLQRLEYVSDLDLSYNRLASAPTHLLTANMTLHLAGNPFACDCEHQDGVSLLQMAADRVADREGLVCGEGGAVRAVDAARLCAGAGGVGGAVGAALAALGLAAALGAALVYRYMLEIKLYLFSRGWCGSLTHEDDAEKKYDAFISFSQQDARWVAEELVPVLEEQHGYKLCVHYRDWVVGDLIPAQIARSVEESRRTVVVLSQSFLSSRWARLEFRAAHERAQRERRARVLVLVLDDAHAHADGLDPELRAYLNTNTYLQWGDPWFWEKLRHALPRGKEKGSKAEPKRGALDARLTADGLIVNDGLAAPKF